MFATLSRADAYNQVGLNTDISEASPHRLIVMLFEGAILAVNTAAVSIEKKDIAGKGQYIAKAIEIISNGLKASLDLKAGGEIAQNLSDLYDYMNTRLLYANLHSNTAALREVGGLLNELKEAWVGIADAGV